MPFLLCVVFREFWLILSLIAFPPAARLSLLAVQSQRKWYCSPHACRQYATEVPVLLLTLRHQVLILQQIHVKKSLQLCSKKEDSDAEAETTYHDDKDDVVSESSG